MNLNKGLCENASGLSIDSLFETFIKEKRFLDNRSELTLKSYKQIFDRFKKYGNTENLNDFIINMREAGLSVTTCNISIRSFNVFLSWAAEAGHTPKLKLKQLKPEKKILRTVSDEQVKAFLSWERGKLRNEQRAYAVMCTMIDCGFRVSELLGLETQNVLLQYIRQIKQRK